MSLVSDFCSFLRKSYLYRDYQKDCEQCVGFETGHECSDAGDCMSNQCQCDIGFSGESCQNARKINY